MRIRWQAHRYLLGQSLTFFHDEFAGRVATKVMQTALSVRETVTKVLDLLVYISVYFISMVVLVFSTDWRLAVPLVVWFLCTCSSCACWYPSLNKCHKSRPMRAL